MKARLDRVPTSRPLDHPGASISCRQKQGPRVWGGGVSNHEDVLVGQVQRQQEGEGAGASVGPNGFIQVRQSAAAREGAR